MPRLMLAYAGLLFLTVISTSAAWAQDENAPSCVGVLSGNFSFVKKITYKPDSVPVGGPTTAQQALSSPSTRLIELDAVQTGAVRRDMEKFADGSIREIWRQQNCRLVVDPVHSDRIMVTFVKDLASPNSVSNYQDPSDFPELDWIKSNLNQGTQEVQDKKCYFYKLDDQTAWIEVATKLPVYYESNAMQVTYTLKPPPEQALQLPVKLSQKLDEFKRAWMGQ